MTTVSNEAEAGTRQRIMETAERLFAEQGFEAVSLRELTQEAEVNLAAVHYHFGGKEELIDQMTSRYMNWVNADRLALLEKLEERGEPAEVAEIVEAFLQPLRTVVSQSERSEAIFYKFMGRCISERNHRLPSEAAELFQRMVSRFSQALERAVPHLDEEELLWRLHFTVGVMVQTLLHADWLPTISQGRSGRPDSETVMRRMTQFCAFGYRAPATDESK
ncbi:MAG: TetR/AcrR family transcriptional regulator [Verrucomicrobiota bacterium]